MSKITQWVEQNKIEVKINMSQIYKRKYYKLIKSRLQEPRKFIQILFGARQVGKTTLITQVLEDINKEYVFVSADNEINAGSVWLTQQWETARIKLKNSSKKELILVIDEIQKIKNWSEAVKSQWDYDTRNKINIKVVFLGSSSILVQKGLSESLAGRYEIIRIPHWSYKEIIAAFGLSLNEYIFFGGYPGSIDLIKDEKRWKQYVRDSLIEPAITKDVLLMSNITKPALLRQLFQLGSIYSGQILSYTKMLGQLQDAGNTTTLANYLNLLDIAGLLCGLQKYSKNQIQTRSSIPKFQVYNSALVSAFETETFKDVTTDLNKWGRYCEIAVGTHLLNDCICNGYKLNYFREGNYEVDFVVTKDNKSVGIEVKSGRNTTNLSGMDLFNKKYKPYKALLVGQKGISFEEFLSLSIADLF